MKYGTTEVARACNVTLNTVRNWCKDYSAYLSPGASGSDGQRVFSGRDLEVVKYIAQLRTEKMQKGAILQRLSETTFAEIDERTDATDTTFTAIQNAPDAQGDASAITVALHAITTLQRRFEALEASVTESKRNQRDGVLMFGVGFIAALLFVVVIIGLAVLYGGVR
jgi:DNA-binding transcriptional MerR regulator